jgi:hypothetical protein
LGTKKCTPVALSTSSCFYLLNPTLSFKAQL